MKPTIFSEDLLKTSYALRSMQAHYTESFDDWAETVPTMDPKDFWRHANRLRVIYNKEDNYDKAVKTFLMEAWRGGEKKFSEAAHFAISYWRYLTLLQEKCKNIKKGWRRPFNEDSQNEFTDPDSEDYVGTVEDLVNAIPMAGEEVCSKLATGYYFVGPDEIDINALEEDVKNNAPSSHIKILNNCHDIEQALHEDLCEFLLIFGPGRTE
jgi:hypothetical protein